MIQYWKTKDRAWYTKRVIARIGVVAEKQRKPRKKKIVKDEELSASDLSDEEFALEQKAAKKKDPLLGKTVTSVRKQGTAPKPTPKPAAKMTDKSTFRLLSDGTLEGKQRMSGLD